MKKFSREQLIAVVESILIGALDVVESNLPTCVDKPSNRNPEAEEHIRGAIDCAGMALSVFFHKVDGVDGIGTYDALDMAGKFHEVLEHLYATSWEDDGKFIYALQDKLAKRGSYHISDVIPLYPDANKYAQQFVNVAFPDYLNEEQTNG